MVWIKVNVIPKLFFSWQILRIPLPFFYVLTHTIGEETNGWQFKNGPWPFVFLNCTATSLFLDFRTSGLEFSAGPLTGLPTSASVLYTHISQVVGFPSESIWTIMLHYPRNLNPIYRSLRNSIMQWPTLSAIKGQQTVVSMTNWFISCFLPACEMKKRVFFSLIYYCYFVILIVQKNGFHYMFIHTNIPTVYTHFPFCWFPCDYLIIHPSFVFIWFSKLTCEKKHAALICVCLISFNRLSKAGSIFSGKCHEFFIMDK